MEQKDKKGILIRVKGVVYKTNKDALHFIEWIQRARQGSCLCKGLKLSYDEIVEHCELEYVRHFGKVV